ncbi:kinesin-like protein KIN-12G [Ananas comosus]|uniref:Kinesin-like protein KIN-12G n=1 Tax=Ananas comosus TaxID=4615 RepID=A0A6P5EUN3_ANACO|nr:kinesin-like protein KIN-12G [Ananas comosus]
MEPVRSRVRFQEAAEESEPENFASEKEAGAATSSAPAAAASASASAAAAGIVPLRFELQEDPSFWKDNNIQVVIRIRPLSSSEVTLQGHNRCVRQENCQTLTWIGHPESRFTFDLVADEHVSQEKLFKVAGVPMVENCVAGYNSCMFAYGQTGSGKTHTMLGDIEGGTRRHSVNCGMTPRVFEYLFSRIQREREARRDEKLRFTCKCSFLEIYNEQILDLLDPTSVNLQIREDARKGVYVENLTEYEVSSARDVMQQLIQGAANRKVAATNMNRASSRSHSVFTCVIESKWELQGISHHRFARINLVDLAGSERQKSSGAEGERLKEATNINKSLSTLGLVIMNLVGVSNKKSFHVPYRDSKLTFLLQDSLGGNSKTIIIANISPSNCCALETLSTLKFAQRAKFIRNNAIVNEDASGDILSMRLQIQQLKKEVNRLQGLVNGSSEKLENDSFSGAPSESPASFKCDGSRGSFSPLTFDKRLSQRKEYEAALVASFKREQDKEATLKAMAAGKQAAEQLAAQRTEEIKSLKMRLRFREEGIRRLQSVASGKLSAEAHLLQEKEELLKEIELLRNQVDRNPEVTRFALENLQLKEELRRLQGFVEEGERERMNEQITVLQDKLLEALDWKLMHEKDQDVVQDLSLSWESSGNEENEFLHLQAIQNQREIEALRKNLNFCLEAKEKLERRVDELVEQLEVNINSHPMNEDTQVMQLPAPKDSDIHDLPDAQMELKTMVDAIASASQREAEAHETAISLAKENEDLRSQLKVLIEDNKRLVDLYENAVAGGATIHPGNLCQSEIGEEQDNSLSCYTEHKNSSHDNFSCTKDAENLELQLQEMHEENEKLMGLYEKAMQERDEFKRMVHELNTCHNKEEMLFPEKQMELDEKGCSVKKSEKNIEVHAAYTELSREVLHLVRTKLKQVQHKVVATEEAVQYFELLESATKVIDGLSADVHVMQQDVQLKQQFVMDLKLVLLQMQERKTIADNKYLALKSALNSFSLKAHQWEEREAQARAGVDSYIRSLEQKKEELRYLQACKNELFTACAAALQSESDLRNKVDGLKQKLRDAEARKKENERVLFAIDNVAAPKSSSLNFVKASELLKSEEERTKLLTEMKQSREQLVTVRKETAGLMSKSEALDAQIGSLEAGIKSSSISLQEAELEYQQVVREMKMFSEMVEDGRAEFGSLFIDFQDCIFQVDLKEEEIRMCEEYVQQGMRSLDELHAKLNLAMQRLNQLCFA